MNEKLQSIFSIILSILIIAASLTIFIGLFTLFFYIAIAGLFLAGSLWVFTLIKEYLLPKGNRQTTQGRIIEHEDNK